MAFLGVGVELDCSSLANEVDPKARDRLCHTSEAASGSRARRVVRSKARGVVFIVTDMLLTVGP